MSVLYLLLYIHCNYKPYMHFTSMHPVFSTVKGQVVLAYRFSDERRNGMVEGIGTKILTQPWL